MLDSISFVMCDSSLMFVGIYHFSHQDLFLQNLDIIQKSRLCKEQTNGYRNTRTN